MSSYLIGKLDSWPEYLTMQGHGFLLQGWNNKYFLIGIDEKGYPIYELPNYTLYGCIDIIGCKISFDYCRKKWAFTRHCDSEPFKFKLGHQQDNPFGAWGLESFGTIYASPMDGFWSTWIKQKITSQLNPFSIALGAFGMWMCMRS